MRCPDCCKFVSMENADPELNLNVDHEGEGMFTITGDVRLVRQCAECGSELKDLTVDVDESVAGEDGWKNKDTGEALSVDDWNRMVAALTEHGSEVEIEDDGGSVEESGGGRYAKNMISFSSVATLTVDVVDAEGTKLFVAEREVEITSEDAASAFEECC